MGASLAWLVNPTAHAVRLAGRALRLFWPTGGGTVVLAKAAKLLSPTATPTAWAAAARVATDVAVAVVVVGGTLHLVHRLRTS